MGFCFAWLGSIWAVGIDAQSMRIGFVAFMIVLAAYNLIRMFAASVQASTQMRYGWPWLAVLGAASGTMGGLFGVGGAVVATPFLTSLFGTSRSEEHTSELQSLMRISYAVCCLKKKKRHNVPT